MGADLIHDAGRWTDWGEISWDENLPPGTDIVIQTKTSLDNLNWSEWSDNYTNPAGQDITSPAGRYIQYRAILGTDNLSLTPELREVRITWPAADAGVRVAEDLVRVVEFLEHLRYFNNIILGTRSRCMGSEYSVRSNSHVYD